MAIPDYYAILQVTPYTAPDGIRAAYNHLEQTAPLVKNASSSYRLQWIREAYFVLSDPARRANYDLERLEHPIEPGGQLASLEDLYKYPSITVARQLSRRNHRILYSIMVIFALVFLWALFTWRIELVMFLITGGLVAVGLGTTILNLREKKSKEDRNDDL